MKKYPHHSLLEEAGSGQDVSAFSFRPARFSILGCLASEFQFRPDCWLKSTRLASRNVVRVLDELSEPIDFQLTTMVAEKQWAASPLIHALYSDVPGPSPEGRAVVSSISSADALYRVPRMRGPSLVACLV